MVIGAALAAAGAPIPEVWIQKVRANLWDEVSAAADKVRTFSSSGYSMIYITMLFCRLPSPTPHSMCKLLVSISH
jgi:hypothetical protein